MDKEDAGREFFANFWDSNIVPRSAHAVHALKQGLVSVFSLVQSMPAPTDTGPDRLIWVRLKEDDALSVFSGWL